ncbi:MAG: type IV-A pilus assembly ATPase PilB [candidate division Zixibacteria bacterium]|nr:type IV-A pilus assembly ATPase PilB [candidate division Zixibacteria bacterium]
MSAELGTMLVKAGKITEDQLKQALDLKSENKDHFGEALVKVGAIQSEEELSDFISKQLNMGSLRLNDVELNPEIVKLIPLDIARKFNVIAVSRLGKTLIVAIADPNNVYVLDAIKFITGCNVQPVISPENSINKSIEKYYDDGGAVSEILKGLEDDEELEVVSSDSEEISESDLQSAVQDKPLVRLVDSIIKEAVRTGASDIHIEMYEKRIRVRYRVDGNLKEMDPLPYKYRAAIISRIKIMSELDISERRLPQDGRIKIKLDNRTVDLRVSVLPTIFGEKVVMRILDPNALMVDMTKLGFTEAALTKFKKSITLPYGIILVTGPTGSGKTTTLYSALKQINTEGINIMTAEDPVEFNFDGINQVAVRSEIGLTFASALRSFLRQDPDVIMVGEIRDGETAEIAIRAALTGHLVFSTLHTNDAPSSIPRLIDMGVPNYLVSSATRMILAQRMTRKLCQECRRPYTLTDEDVESLGVPDECITTRDVFESPGCPNCNGTGQSGRTGIYEVMPISDAIEQMILEGKTDVDIGAQAISDGMLTLRMAAVNKMMEGDIGMKEVFAVTSGGH